MPVEKKSGGLAQYGSILGPVAGLLVALVLIAVAVFTDSVSKLKDELTGQNQRVSTALSSKDVMTEAPNLATPDQVSSALTADKGGADRVPRNVDALLKTPISWDVRIEAGEQDEFDQYDENQDKYWDEREFRATPYYSGPAPRNDFKKWDKDSDGKISRSEHSTPPGNPEEIFTNQLDKDGNGHIDESEMSAAEIKKMDFDQDSKVTLDEYKRYDAGERPEFYNIGDPSGVTAVFDQAKMQITISWEPPTQTDLPPDLKYLILRRAPETVEKRQKEYGKRVLEYQNLLKAWEGRRDAWLNTAAMVDAKGDPDPNGSAVPDKTFKQVLTRSKWDAAFALWAERSGSADPKPREPERASEWEFVTETTQTTHDDNTFDLDVTYTYAVRAVTGKELFKGIPFEVYESYKSSKRISQDGHPVLVRNRIEMSWQSGSEGGGTVLLTQWVNIRDAGNVNWYRISIIVTVDPDNVDVGKEYTVAELLNLNVSMSTADGTPATPKEVLPADLKVNFNTRSRFEAKLGANFLIKHTEFGDFELTRDTKAPAAVIPDATGMDNPAEVRLLGLSPKAKSGFFEVRRWHKVGEAWYLVIQRGKVDAGKTVGREVSMSAPGADVEVRDSAGAVVSAAVLRGAEFKDQTVNLAVGTFDGVDKRVAKVDGKEFDLFATLYVE